MEIGPLGRHHSPLQRRRRDQPARFGQPGMHHGAKRRRQTVGIVEWQGAQRLRELHGRADRWPALQQAKAGVEAIYLSGWQVAADANSAAAMYPDQSLYPVDSVPKVVERINNTFRRADQINGLTRLSRAAKATPIISCRSSPMRKPASAAC